jgi:DNA topoisomerase-1
VRRFLATFGKPMITESARADIKAGAEDYFVRGSIVVDPGYAAIYTYARSADNELPALEEGQKLELDGAPWMVDKETQPPSRISQGKLIEMMEELGLGTKATRPDIIQKLYSRGYVYNNPPEPSETGIAMYKAFREHVLRMATPEMTAELEHDMDEIAAGKSSKDEVIKISRDMLHQTYDDLFERREELAKTIWAGMDEDKYIGFCEVCEEKGRKRENGEPNRLRIIDLKGGKRFWGCEGYNRDDPEDPESCTNSGPLPGRGYELFRLEPKCSICGVRPRLSVKAFRGRPWKLCLNDDCPSMVEMREKRAERLAAREAAAKKKAEEGGDDGAAAKAKPKPKRGGSGGRKKPPTTTTRTKRATRGKTTARSGSGSATSGSGSGSGTS